jgi:hypothetical protein
MNLQTSKIRRLVEEFHDLRKKEKELQVILTLLRKERTSSIHQTMSKKTLAGPSPLFYSKVYKKCDLLLRNRQTRLLMASPVPQ